MASDKSMAMILYQEPWIRFQTGGSMLAEARLSDLRRFLVVTCFEAADASDPVPEQFDLLDFGTSYWLVTDGSAERFLDREWATHLQERQGYFEANAGALPKAWRKSFLLLVESLYRPKAAVVPAVPLTFLTLEGPLDPTRIGERNRERAFGGRGSQRG